MEEICLNLNDKKSLDNTKLNDLKFKLNKRVQLLKHFFKNFDHNYNKKNKKNETHKIKILKTKQKENLIAKITKHLDKKKHNNTLFQQIQNFILYSIYLEENSIINYIKNPHRIFSNLYYQIDIPTKVIS